MLRQDPVECLFQFICSSNNHISRIHGMVERLCSTYGSPLLPSSTCSSTGEAAGSPAERVPLPQQEQQQVKQGAAELGFASPGTPAAAAAAWAGEAAVLLQQEQQLPFGEPFSPLLPFTAAAEGSLLHQQQQQLPMQQQEGLSDGMSSCFAFPTLEQLSAASEEALRADGFGYRWGCGLNGMGGDGWVGGLSAAVRLGELHAMVMLTAIMM
jgi:hypothetical protein